MRLGAGVNPGGGVTACPGYDGAGNVGWVRGLFPEAVLSTCPGYGACAWV
ncbi:MULTISPECIES: hypothetical protein [Enterobacteriaceae]|uniref:Uncharacterized protein n=1 Tax=Raoultella lignicola TaxID=3040939 RepID=A0ABU9FEK7_9ENTR|nr:hypothetical protein [Enterobacter sp. JUb54]QNK09876.1 hypothetical protein HF679_10785 [Enterobacter sp. JUb54]